ncbi:hypothetical protein SteCoe_32255 [Stentor coeruleus]|uniref:Phosphodiesterase n=1 Tax=Stentor coeruleus TaxID=5963 RepID=A0A1R2AZH4_9CILI|nr:hypothetical protein SteCoe_32255 [Stentor coeruleus]
MKMVTLTDLASLGISLITMNIVGFIGKIALIIVGIQNSWILYSIYVGILSFSRSPGETAAFCWVFLSNIQCLSTQELYSNAILQIIILLLIGGLFTNDLTLFAPVLLCIGYKIYMSSIASQKKELEVFSQRVQEENKFYIEKLETLKKSFRHSPKLRRSSSLLNKLRSLQKTHMVQSFTEGSDNDSPMSDIEFESGSRRGSSSAEEKLINTPKSSSSVIEHILPGISNEEIKEIITALISQEYLLWNPEKCGEQEVDVIAVALEAKKVFTQSIETLPGSSHRVMPIKKGTSRLRSIRSMVELSEPLSQALESIGEWDFDCFELIKVTKDPAFEVGFYIFNTLGLCERFQIDNASLRKFLTTVENGYNRNNFYHNSIHAADVTASTLFLIQKGLSRCGNLVDLDVFALIVAALCHDIGHPGVNNAFLVATGNELALKYNDLSCLENMHSNKAFTIMRSEGCKITQYLCKPDFQRFRKSVLGAILSTDLQVHFDKVTEFRVNLDKKLDISDDKFRHLAIQMCLKCADIGHGARKLAIHIQWTCLITKEFFKQGEKEREFGIPVTPLCDRDNCIVSKSQVGFLEYLVTPLFKVWEDFIEQNNEEESELETRICLMNVRENIEYWNEEHKNYQLGKPNFFLDSDPPVLGTEC